MEELRIEANGLHFRCLAAGPEEGPLALLLHGFPEGAESWSFQLEALAAQGLRAVAPGMRRYGCTHCPPDEEAYGMSELVEDVAGLIRNLGSSTCHLAGHDWGSLVGWACTSRHLERALGRPPGRPLPGDEGGRGPASALQLHRPVSRARQGRRGAAGRRLQA